MADDNCEFDSMKFSELMAERMRWARLFVTIQEIAEDNKELVRDLSTYDPTVAVPLLAGLLTLPNYQSHCIRLEILVALAVVHCHGRKKAHIDQAIRWFSQISKSRCVTAEDQLEDVFVSLVQDEHEDYRLFEGVWEGAGFYTQRVLDVIATMPDKGQLGQIKKTVRALLTISDMVCDKARLQRYQLGSDEHHSVLSARNVPGGTTLISRVTVTFAELDERGITRSDIEPFLFLPQMKTALPAQQIASSYLDRHPLIGQGDTHLVIALPSALSVAVRDYAIASIIEGGLVKTFDGLLASNYARLLSDTPLLGGPMHAPVRWKALGEHRWCTFFFEVDEGYYISYHLFLPTVQTHANGGFINDHHIEDALVGILHKSIDDVLAHLANQPNFKKGLVIFVDCGWGKSCATQRIELNNTHWWFQRMSAADLVRLSWLSEMKPDYLWRIQDGLEAVTKAGVEILNLNGILNLIGWVRSNHGHFVPQAQLTDGMISPERPLVLCPPLNLLRQVRADSDRGYDRHRSMDNTGTWHDVQHASPNPFFSSDSARRVYTSMDGVRSGTLTSVYEGTLRLWISVSTPSITQRKVTYQLWEMANEWLHRIGAALDARAEGATKTFNVKVYVEFCDVDSPEDVVGKSIPEDLIPLCAIEAHSEPNACKAVFGVGFFSGFRIADNVAERLFVRNIVRAFLHVLGVENGDGEIEAIEDRVVRNNEARHYHLFHVQNFMDHVLDTLPATLIAIDSIDDAAAKIGLGWRVIGKDQGNKIEGREACTNFLAEVVDALSDDIINALATFDRLSTLKRLVANCEKASVERDLWKRTSAATLGLHGHNPDTVDRVGQQMSKCAGAGIASRILSEIALCVCPLEGGAPLSSIEMSKLIARAALIVGIGGLSDAIYYNALAPELTISQLGDILCRDEFGNLVVKPMLSRMMGDSIIANAPLQENNYEAPEILTDARGRISDEFWGIWKNEMGFDINEARNIIGALEDKGIAEHTAILEIAQSDYFTLVCSDSVPKGAAERFLGQFSLATRPRWQAPPKGFTSKDIYPWRFGRRLSFMTRPILKVNDSDDPVLVIAPASLSIGFAYVVDGAHSGRLDRSYFRTKEMKDIWWGKAREGHSFNAEVARALSDASWQVRANIRLPELLGRKVEDDLGDIDVLAWRSDQNRVLVIECKDLSPARNYSEIAALLSDYQGVEADGEADRLKRHLNRVSLLRDNQEELQRFTKIQQPQIVSCLICSGVVPMQYARIDALADTHVGTVEKILAL